MVLAVGDAEYVGLDVFTKGVAQTGQMWHARGLDGAVPPQLLDDGGVRVRGLVLQFEEHLVITSCLLLFL